MFENVSRFLSPSMELNGWRPTFCDQIEIHQLVV